MVMVNGGHHGRIVEWPLPSRGSLTALGGARYHRVRCVSILTGFAPRCRPGGSMPLGPESTPDSPSPAGPASASQAPSAEIAGPTGASDSNEPPAFDYAPRSRFRWWPLSPAQRLVVYVGLALFVAGLLNHGLDIGHTNAACATCGARSQVQDVGFCGWSHDYPRRITEGPVSAFIQERDGRKCSHQWVNDDFDSGNLIYGIIGDCIGDGRGSRIARLEECPHLKSVLRKRCETAPAFVDDLKKAIMSWSDDASRVFLDDLECEAMGFPRVRPAGSPASRPAATQPTSSDGPRVPGNQR